MRLMIVPCAAAVLSFWMCVGLPEETLASGFGDQTGASSGFQGQFGEQPAGVGKRRQTRTYRKHVPSAPPAAAQGQSRVAAQGNSREPLYARCRSAVFQAYGRHYVYPDGRRALALPGDWVVGQVDACVANGGKPI